VTIQRPLLLKLLVPLMTFAATLAVIAALNRSSSPAPGTIAGSGGAVVQDARSTDARIASLQQAIREDGANPDRDAALGDAYLQKARETGDAGFYVRAEQVYGRALKESPAHAAALAGMATLRLGQHMFRAAFDYAERARAAAPDVVRYYGPLVDAQVELGRYGAAEQTLQRMVDLKPNLASYARVSYLRELHGDLDGAARAMRLAASAGGDAPENYAYVQTLVANIELARGRTGGARQAYRFALERYPGYVPAQAGLARVDADRGDLSSAIGRYEKVVARLPLPEYVIGLAETELAAGRRASAREHIALVRVEQQLLARNGVNTDTELALFEANHGSGPRALSLARRAWAAAPSVRSADALGWALTRSGNSVAGLSWAQRALELGSKDRLFLYHAGMSARAAGETPLARRYLRRSLALNPRFSPLYAPRARRALEALR
jgi:tetratricopeptide (TPR) repeat protein